MVPMQRYRSIVKGQCSYRLLEVVETLMDLDGLSRRVDKIVMVAGMTHAVTCAV